MESERIRIVESFLNLYLEEENELKNLVYLASEVCQTPIASINFIDDKKQYPVVSKGAIKEMPRNISFCTHTIKGECFLEVPDALNDSLFAQNPFVTGNPYVRFYAGSPLITTCGATIGTLCVLDYQPKKLTEGQKNSLQILSKQVVNRLELYLNTQLLKERVLEKQHNKELIEQAEVMNVFYGGSNDYFLLLNNKFQIASFNASADSFFKQRNNGPFLKKGERITNYLLPSNVSIVKQFLRKAQKGQTSSFEILANPGSANSFWNRFTISPAYNSKKELIGLACIGCNIDKEKRQQEKIENQYAVLLKIAKIHSHEIRHPLTNILAIIDMLKHEDFVMTSQYIEFLEASARELDGIIRNVVIDSYTSA